MNADLGKRPTKKRCLCVLMVLGLLVISANMSITALILFYIRVSQPAVGDILLGVGRTFIDGQLLIAQGLTTSNIQSSDGTLKFASASGFNFDVVQNDSFTTSFQLASDTTVKSTKLTFQDEHGNEFLMIGRDRFKASFKELELKGRAKSLPSVQTRDIYAASDLKISSSTKGLEMVSASGMTLQSFGGKLTSRLWAMLL